MIRRLILTFVVANLGEAAIVLVNKEPTRLPSQLILWVGTALVLAARDFAKP